MTPHSLKIHSKGSINPQLKWYISELGRIKDCDISDNITQNELKENKSGKEKYDALKINSITKRNKSLGDIILK